MKRVINLALILCLLPLGAWTTIGINFRATSGYVTDGTDETYCLADSYPTTRGGVTFGWTTIDADAARDRDSALDRRLAGVNKSSNSGTQANFQIDLSSSGTKTVCLALGEGVFDWDYQYLQILDNVTSKVVIDKSTPQTGMPKFYDAEGTLHTGAAWPGSNVCVSVEFASTTMNVKIGTPSAQTGNSSIAHISVTDASSTTTFPVFNAIGED